MTAEPITFVDVETTGLSRDDRVVSVGIIYVPNQEMLYQGRADISGLHLVFNPGRPSDPRARKVHGYSDADLANQDSFAQHAESLRPFFSHGGRVVAHNASFDRRFLSNEFKRLGSAAGDRDYFCTMLAHRSKYGSKSGLDAVLTQMGRSARAGHHGALEDALHAMQIYAWLHGFPIPDKVEGLGPPSNYRETALRPNILPVSELEVAAAPPTHSARFIQVQKQLKPMALMMMSIARADGDFSRAEVDTISLFINTRLSTMAVDLSGEEYLDLLDDLCRDVPDEDRLNSACKMIVQDATDRQEVASWIRQMTFADGEGSDAERLVILRITNAMRNALS